MTDVDHERGRARRSRKRGLDTRRRLLDAAEAVFGELGYPDASIVKITEAAGVAQGTFYLYFDSKQAVFDELVRDLNQRVRHAMKEGSSRGRDPARGGAARLRGVLPLHRRAPGALPDHPAGRVRLAGDAALPLRPPLAGLRRGAARGVDAGEIGADVDPEVTAWALMGLGELIGMRWILWSGKRRAACAGRRPSSSGSSAASSRRRVSDA